MWLSIFLTATILTSCDTVLQFPEEPDHQKGKVILLLTANIDFPMLGEYKYDFKNPYNTTGNISRENLNSHQLRFTICVYSANEKAYSPTPKAKFTFTEPIGQTIDSSFNLELIPGDYRLVVWADYVDHDSSKDKYYDTSDFSCITLRDNDGHPGSNPYRDAFYGEADVHVNMPDESTSEISVTLKRPMAKYTFVSNDLREFFDKETARIRRTDAADNAPSLADYTVRIVYTRYMPCSFNVHIGKPADSRTGVEYRSLISVIDEDKAQLAFDYVFTNGAETSIAVAMEIIHRDGTVVGRVPQFNVPLKGSHHTIITGKFLTTKSGGTIGINNKFDGNFNIHIQ